MIWYVTRNKQWKTNKHIPVLQRGWGNGYVAVPPTHPAYKMDYNNLMYDIKYNINVHGGLTYSGFADHEHAPDYWWVFGFDTAHFEDTIEKWPKEAVEAETKRLYCQLLDIEWGEL